MTEPAPGWKLVTIRLFVPKEHPWAQQPVEKFYVVADLEWPELVPAELRTDVSSDHVAVYIADLTKEES